MSLACFWFRRRLAPFLDGALRSPGMAGVASHLEGCAACRAERARLERLRTLVRSSQEAIPEPDWAGFWEGIRRRIASEAPGRRPEGWRWAPRLALGGSLAGLVLLGAVLWPGGSPEAPSRPPSIVVTAVETAYPEENIMIFASPEDEVTVIWVLGPERPGDQSRLAPLTLS